MPYLSRRVESSLAKAGVKVPKNPLKVLKLLLVILLLAHINSCVFFALANFDQHANSGNVYGQSNWANNESIIDPAPQCPGIPVPLKAVSQQYTAGLYWAMVTSRYIILLRVLVLSSVTLCPFVFFHSVPRQQFRLSGTVISLVI